MNILALNPGGNSIKAEFVQCNANQRYAFEGETRFGLMIEGIGTKPQLSRMQGKKKAATESIVAESYAQGAFSSLKWWENPARNDDLPRLSDVDGIAIRVVHGEREFRTPVPIDSRVIAKITEFEKLAPFHNKSSIKSWNRSSIDSPIPPFTLFSIRPFIERYPITPRLTVFRENWRESTESGGMVFIESRTVTCSSVMRT
jgi:acetate kinase